MAYTRHTWAAGPAGNTPITYTKLNEMETGIYNAHSLVATAQSTATSANTRSTTNATNITNLTTRVSDAEDALSSQQTTTNNLNWDVSSLRTTVNGHTTTISGHTNSISSLTSRVGTAESGISTLDDRVTDLENSGGGGGGTASLTICQFVNNGTWTIANNAWLSYPRLVNRPAFANSSDLTVASTTRGVIQVLRTGIYLMSMTVVDTLNPAGQGNFLCNTVRVADVNASSVLQVLARFQHYSTNQGSGSSVMQLNQGDYVSFQFRQNATGGSMSLPDGVAAVNEGTYVGCSLAFVKLN